MVWISEDNLANTHPDIEQWFADQVHCARIQMPDGVTLAYAKHIPEDARAAIVLSTGRVESYLKYQALFYELAAQGFAVYACDHRGQGLSQRMAANRMAGHIDDFAQYRDDLSRFVTHIVQPDFTSPYLLCHSMGGAIGLLCVLDHPEMFARVAMTAPMLGLVSPLPKWLANLLLSLGLLGSNVLQKPLYFVGQKDYEAAPFAQNKLTHSEVRYEIFRRQQDAYPDTQLGGVTYGWVAAALRATHWIETYCYQISVPVLCVSAGDDVIVDNRAQSRCIEQIAHGQWVTIPGAKHELLFERDEYRTPTLDAIMTFFSE